MIWWEKTVEYKFVLDHADTDSLVTPLDGNHERAGDVIFQNGTKCLLIEFKRDEGCISSELKKFASVKAYNLAKGILAKGNTHHFVIYGEISDRDFVISSKLYFHDEKFDSKKIITSGVDKEKFDKYLTTFLKYKKKAKAKADSGAGFSQVLGVSANGKIVKCMTTADYSKTLGLDYTHDQSSTHESVLGL